jgi:hypothetical protein
MGSSGSSEYAASKLKIESVGEGSWAAGVGCAGGCSARPTAFLGMAMEPAEVEFRRGGELTLGVSGSGGVDFGVDEATGFLAMLLTLLILLTSSFS